MTDYNKIITTVNSITPDYQFIPDLNNTIVIDTSENRIGINTITPDENIHVSGGTIKTQDLIVLGDLSINNLASSLIPPDDLSHNIGSIDYRWNELFVGSGSIYMDKTRIIRMGDYTRHGANDISALIFDNSGKHLDISDIRHVNIQGDVSFNSSIDISDQLIIHGDASFNSNLDLCNQLIVHGDSSLNSNLDVSGVLHIIKSIEDDGRTTTGTKIYTLYENNSSGKPTTRLIIDPSGVGVTGTEDEQGEVIILGNLNVKGSSTFIQSTNIDVSDNIIRMNANHNAVTEGGIAVKNSSNVDKFFTYNNPGDFWTTNNTNINLGPDGGVVTSGFMNIDNINIDSNTIDVDSGDLILKSDTGQVVVENITFNSNTISTNSGLDLNLTAAGGNIYTQGTNLDLGTGGVLTVNGVENAHVPTGTIVLWYGNSSNIPAGWAKCDGNNGTPNLSGRFIVCSGSSPTGDTYNEGETGGTNKPNISIQQIPPHNHGASSTPADVNHYHSVQITSGNTSADHTHQVQITSQGNSASHSHSAGNITASNAPAHTHGTNVNLTINSDGQEHYHEVHQHFHPVEHPQHTHNAAVNFRYSSDEGSDGFNSLVTDDQTFNVPYGNTMSISQVGGSVAIHPVLPVQSNTGEQVGTGPNGPVVNTSQAKAPNGNDWGHNHPQSTVNVGINPAGDHGHSISGNTGQDQVTHHHTVNGTTGQQLATHNHTVNGDSGHTSIDHNHPISTTPTGGGQEFDNRPEYYSLWYIMKL